MLIHPVLGVDHISIFQLIKLNEILHISHIFIMLSCASLFSIHTLSFFGYSFTTLASSFHNALPLIKYLNLACLLNSLSIYQFDFVFRYCMVVIIVHRLCTHFVWFKSCISAWYTTFQQLLGQMKKCKTGTFVSHFTQWNIRLGTLLCGTHHLVYQDTCGTDCPFKSFVYIWIGDGFLNRRRLSFQRWQDIR